jgi:subtilisin-like proprotein convertase family protein
MSLKNFVLIVFFISTLFLLISPVIRAETICSSSSLTIPDNDNTGITDTLSLSDNGSLTDLNIIIDVEHSHIGELTVALEHNGTSVTLIEQPGIPSSSKGCLGQNIDHLILDDEGSNSVENDCTPTNPAYNSASYQPNGSLSDFNGHNVNGDWTLIVIDPHDFSF